MSKVEKEGVVFRVRWNFVPLSRRPKTFHTFDNDCFPDRDVCRKPKFPSDVSMGGGGERGDDGGSIVSFTEHNSFFTHI